MGIITTTPGNIPGPTTGFGWDVRNTQDAAPYFDPQSEFAADVDRVVACGGTWVRLGIEPWMIGWHDDTNPTAGPQGDGWYWDQAGINLLLGQVRYAHSKGLRISLTVFPNTFGSSSDDLYRAWNLQAMTKLATLVGRYVTIVQIFNEHNKADFRTLQDLPTINDPAYLARIRGMIKAFGDEWRRIAPHVLVTTTLYGYPADQWMDRWIGFYDAVGDVCDVIGLNVYPAASQSAIDAIPAMIRRVQGRYSKPVAILETGYASTTSQGDTDLTTIMPAMMDMWRTTGVMCAILYTLRDKGQMGSTVGEDRFGVYYVDGTSKPYRAPTAAKTATVTRRAARWGDALPLVAGASTDAASVSWRVVSGGGRLAATTGGATLYLPPGRVTSGTATLGVTVDGGTERQITVTLAAHPHWAYVDGSWRPTKTGPGITR